MSFRGLAELGVNLIGKDNVSGVLHKIGKNSEKTESRLTKMGRKTALAFDALAVSAGAAAIKIGVDGVKAAIEDEKASAILANTLKNTTKATDAQVKSVEKYITKAQFATGVNDNDLRESLGKLLRATKDVTKAQKLQSLALDISAGSGKDLQSVSIALAKASMGNFGALTRLGVPLDKNIIKTKDFNKAQQELAKTFSGAAAKAADTTAGKFEILKQRFDEAKEKVGLLLLEGLQPLIKWATSPEGTKVLEKAFKVFGAVIKDIMKDLPKVMKYFQGLAKIASGFNFKPDKKLLYAASVFRLTPGGLQVKAIAALAAYAALDSGEQKTGTEKRLKRLKTETGVDVSGPVAVGRAGFGLFPGLGPVLQDVYDRAFQWAFDNYGPKDQGRPYGRVPKNRKHADGGIFMGPRFGLIAEAGPEAVIPLNKAGNLGMTVNIHVAGSVVHERDLAVMVRDNIGQLMRRRGLNPSILGV